MRDFSDKDRRKKKTRIQLPENPANLPTATLQQLETAVTASLKDGYLPCPAAWKIAKDFNVPRINVGAALDRLGRRITDCQLGCFKVDKTPYNGTTLPVRDDIADVAATYCDMEELTCTVALNIARKLKAKPIDVANAANVRGCKIRRCQLGCF